MLINTEFLPTFILLDNKQKNINNSLNQKSIYKHHERDF